ncbi:MAG: radical SAM protein, partial [Armatimonadetes bacterium]|nr:radical SAM protein [Armatimonadota bacterium]
SIGKRITLEEVRQVVDWCRQLRLSYNPFMILSHPGETEEEALETMRLVSEWHADGAQVSMAVMHVYPGTRIEKLAREKGIIPQDFSWVLKEHAKRIAMLPTAQGDVPIFLDKLSWSFLSGLLFEWARMQRYSVLKRIPRAILSIKSLSDLRRYWEMLKAYKRIWMRKLTH